MNNPEDFDDGMTQVAPKGEFKKGCGKRLPTRKRKVRDSLVCNQYQLCDKCSSFHDKEKSP